VKVVILAGGLGTRLAEETETRPKPMVEIGDRPILWHIMKIYSAYGLNDFVICLGYRGYIIKEYFANYYLHTADVTFDVLGNSMEVHSSTAEPWRVTLVDTGAETMTGGRLRRVLPYIGDEEFCFTYGDGLADINIDKLVAFHREQGALATVTSVQPLGRFGSMELEGSRVVEFREKPPGDGAWINGGFFVLSPRVGKYLVDDATVWEQEPLHRLAAEGQLSAYRHDGFWLPMDTLRDKLRLQSLWDSGDAPWQVWE
jgi:glucose-1-phosphate cytidylyltransferase